MRDGFYWFCPPTTPFYPGLHNLGSRDWTSDEREPQPALGEWSGGREWYRGDAPARRPLPVLVGTSDCIENGEKPGLPIIPDASAFCGEILPAACYAVEDTIKANTNVEDCVFGKKSADLIILAYVDLVAAEAAAQAILGPMAVVSSFPQPNAFTPAGVIATIGTTAVVWLTGTTDFTQLACQAFYFATGSVNQGLFACSAIYADAANAIAAQLVAAGAGGALRYVLVGHSFGGAVCMVLGAKSRIADPSRNVEYMTFGSPSAGDQRLYDFTFGATQTHYVNLNDPIPYMPPGGILFAGLVPIMGPLLALEWPGFARPEKIRVVTEDGEFTTILSADIPNGPITATVIAIAAGLDVPQFKNHLLDWYAYYLCLACKCVPRPCVPPAEPVLGFMLELDALAFDQGAGPEVLSAPLTTLPATAFFPSGKASTWEATIAGVAHLVIEAAVDLAGEYTSFRVTTDPDPVPPTWLCFWDFNAAEMLAGIDTSDPPDGFADTFISLGSLVVLPNLS